MIDGIEPLYRTIAESITATLQRPWATAWIDVIFFPDHVFYSGEFVAIENTPPKSFPTCVEGESAFEQLRELFKAARKPLWCRARFELHSDGRFKMNWGYDDCDADGFAHFDEQKELNRMKALRDRLA
jgi:hypothetical protein